MVSYSAFDFGALCDPADVKIRDTVSGPNPYHTRTSKSTEFSLAANREAVRILKCEGDWIWLLASRWRGPL